MTRERLCMAERVARRPRLADGEQEVETLARAPGRTPADTDASFQFSCCHRPGPGSTQSDNHWQLESLFTFRAVWAATQSGPSVLTLLTRSLGGKIETFSAGRVHVIKRDQDR